MLQCCKFAEGDSRILMQKIARVRPLCHWQHPASSCLSAAFPAKFPVSTTNTRVFRVFRCVRGGEPLEVAIDRGRGTRWHCAVRGGEPLVVAIDRGCGTRWHCAVACIAFPPCIASECAPHQAFAVIFANTHDAQPPNSTHPPLPTSAQLPMASVHGVLVGMLVFEPRAHPSLVAS